MVKELKICYIGGGSRNWAWTLMKDLAKEQTLAGTVHLYDIDQEAASANQDLGNSLMDRHNKNQWKFKAEPSLEKALVGSDFVIISILPADFAEMAVDVHAPEQYGIYQSVGDTAGPGGILRSLRTIPIYQGFARAIGQWAPDAWVLNYTNPMTLCTRTLYQELPTIKAFGCCHEVFGTQKILREMLISQGKVAGDAITRDDIKTNVMGINHFTWIDQATWGTEDLLPLYRDFCIEHAKTGFPAVKDPNRPFSYFESGERVKMDLFLRYGLIAAAGDRHLAEFCPVRWYLDSPELADSWGFTLTPVSYRIEQRERLKNMSIAYRNGTATMVPEASGEEGIRILKALVGLGDLVTNVNLPNQGQMPDLPARAVVETNALFGRDSVQPILTKGLPSPIRSLTMNHVQIQEGLLEAALERDLDKAFAVFLNDPQVAKINRTQAAGLFKTMTERTLPSSSGYSPFTY
jgi:galacturan 1,4-alpha-galacturonidase